MLYRFLKYVIINAVLVLATGTAFSQKMGYIESSRILEKMPEYQKAASFIESLVNNWQKEIDQRQEQIDSLRRFYEAEEHLLTEVMRESRLGLIEQKEQELREFQNSRFGYGGMLQIQKKQMMEPVHKKMKKAVEIVGRMKRVEFIFDVSAGLFMPYANDSRNYTEAVLEYMELPADG